VLTAGPQTRLAYVETRRKPNPAERRRLLCDAAIGLLAEEGARGVSHLKVDRRAGVPDGTTSFYYRTRSALLHGVAEQLVRYDIDTFTNAFKEAPNSEGDEILGMLSKQIIMIREEPHLSRTRARLELTMLSRHDPDLASGFQDVFDGYRSLAERLVIGMQSDRGSVDRLLVAEQASVLLNYLSGLVFGIANGASEPASREDIERQIRAVVIGVAAERG
jgi:AcrR family transcriptional regulator